jgi:hypothetical protein
VNYGSPVAFRMALETRLAASSREAGVDLNRLRRRAVFERVLVRLDDDPRGGWILKGGMALEIRWRDRARATRDLDLATSASASSAVGLRTTLAAALDRDPQGDWFQFVLGSERALTADAAGRAGWRYPIEARLAGRQFAQVTVDVVERTEEIGSTERLPLPGTLAFAGIPTGSVEIVDRNQHFAEKLHALTKTYGKRSNTRTRDLVDLLMLIEDGLAPTRELCTRVGQVFAVREEHDVPMEIPAPPPEWTDVYPALAGDLELHAQTVEHAIQELRTFWARANSTEEI